MTDLRDLHTRTRLPRGVHMALGESRSRERALENRTPAGGSGDGIMYDTDPQPGGYLTLETTDVSPASDFPAFAADFYGMVVKNDYGMLLSSTLTGAVPPASGDLAPLPVTLEIDQIFDATAGVGFTAQALYIDCENLAAGDGAGDAAAAEIDASTVDGDATAISASAFASGAGATVGADIEAESEGDGDAQGAYLSGIALGDGAGNGAQAVAATSGAGDAVGVLSGANASGDGNATGVDATATNIGTGGAIGVLGVADASGTSPGTGGEFEGIADGGDAVGVSGTATVSGGGNAYPFEGFVDTTLVFRVDSAGNIHVKSGASTSLIDDL